MSPTGVLSILHVVAPAPFGGLESVLRGLAAGHAGRGHDIRVAAILSSRAEPHPFVSALERDGVTTSIVAVASRDYLAERRAIRSLCRDARPDIVHTHGFRPDVVDGGVARGERIPIVSTCHGFIEGDWKGRAYQALQRRALRRFDAVIAVSDPIAARLRAAKIDDDRIHVIPNAFARGGVLVPRGAARAQLGLTEGPVVGWVGRLSSEKGPDLAIDAFARLADKRTRLAIIGDGRERDVLHQRAQSLGVADRISWCGSVPDAGRFFSAFDAFLLSSRTEGTPIALLEAMAASVPIVATSVGGVPQVVDDSCAILVPAGDAAAMATALGQALGDLSAACARAERACQRVEQRFATDRWLDRHEMLYRDLAGSPRRGR